VGGAQQAARVKAAEDTMADLQRTVRQLTSENRQLKRMATQLYDHERELINSLRAHQVKVHRMMREAAAHGYVPSFYTPNPYAPRPLGDLPFPGGGAMFGPPSSRSDGDASGYWGMELWVDDRGEQRLLADAPAGQGARDAAASGGARVEGSGTAKTAHAVFEIVVTDAQDEGVYLKALSIFDTARNGDDGAALGGPGSAGGPLSDAWDGGAAGGDQVGGVRSGARGPHGDRAVRAPAAERRERAEAVHTLAIRTLHTRSHHAPNGLVAYHPLPSTLLAVDSPAFQRLVRDVCGFPPYFARLLFQRLTEVRRRRLGGLLQSGTAAPPAPPLLPDAPSPALSVGSGMAGGRGVMASTGAPVAPPAAPLLSFTSAPMPGLAAPLANPPPARKAPPPLPPALGAVLTASRTGTLAAPFSVGGAGGSGDDGHVPGDRDLDAALPASLAPPTATAPSTSPLDAGDDARSSRSGRVRRSHGSADAGPPLVSLPRGGERDQSLPNGQQASVAVAATGGTAASVAAPAPQPEADGVSALDFVQFWYQPPHLTLAMAASDRFANFWKLLCPLSQCYVFRQDLQPLLEALMDFHPELAGLAVQAPQRAAYLTVMLTSIFCSIHGQRRSRISYPEMKCSNLVDALYLVTTQSTRHVLPFSIAYFEDVSSQFMRLRALTAKADAVAAAKRAAAAAGAQRGVRPPTAPSALSLGQPAGDEAAGEASSGAGGAAPADGQDEAHPLSTPPGAHADGEGWVSRAVLAQHGDPRLCPLVLERIFAGIPRPLASQRPGHMCFDDFVWFLLAERDRMGELAMPRGGGGGQRGVGACFIPPPLSLPPTGR
jgi:hypothetical protein